MRLRITLMMLFAAFSMSVAQDLKNESQLAKYGVSLYDNEKWEDALVVFKNLLRADSSNADYLWRTSYIYSKVGFLQPTEEIRQQWYATAAYLGKKSITQHPQNAYCHYAYAVSLGRMSEHAGSKTKIDNARLIKSEAETALRLDARLPGPYHILGRWHRVVAGFSGFERAMIKTIFGGMPGGSYDDAIRNFEKAIALEPLNAIHYYELAVTFLERKGKNDKQNAINWLQKAVQIPVKTDDDMTYKKQCEELLKKTLAKKGS